MDALRLAGSWCLTATMTRYAIVPSIAAVPSLCLSRHVCYHTHVLFPNGLNLPLQCVDLI
jgi:hypothetical protein